MLLKLEFGDVGFCGGRKTGEPGEKPSKQDDNQQQIQPTHGTGQESSPRHTGGRRTFSPLRLPCFPILFAQLW